MSGETVAPLTPPGCDLRGLEWMPLYGARLFGSDFDAHATDAEWRAALQLWWSAWNQVPAASLPDDDVALCRLSGFGRDLKGWSKVRARALHGFIKCSDGRLYHKALAVFAAESWTRRLKDRERKAKYRAAKERADDADGTRTETGTGCGHDAAGDGHGTADEMRRDEMGQDGTLDSGAAAAAPTRREDVAFGVWQSTAATRGWPDAQFMTSTRRFRMSAILDICGGVDGWQAALDKAATADFLKTEGGQWQPWFKIDWLLDQDHFTKLMEGNYDTRDTHQSSGIGRGSHVRSAGGSEAAAFARAAARLERNKPVQ